MVHRAGGGAAARAYARLPPNLRSAAAQRVLGFVLSDLQLALAREWRLPRLLQSLMDDAWDHPRCNGTSLCRAGTPLRAWLVRSGAPDILAAWKRSWACPETRCRAAWLSCMPRATLACVRGGMVRAAWRMAGHPAGGHPTIRQCAALCWLVAWSSCPREEGEGVSKALVAVAFYALGGRSGCVTGCVQSMGLASAGMC